MGKTVVILMGLQGSGKSTFYRMHFSEDFVRVNLDTLKTRALTLQSQIIATSVAIILLAQVHPTSLISMLQMLSTSLAI